MSKIKKIFFIFCVAAIIFIWISPRIGSFLVIDQLPLESEAVVVLYTGSEYYSRLVEAADLYKNNFVKKVIINGNRKSDILRDLESQGFKHPCPWYSDYMGLLNFLGVPKKDIIHISGENVYDTMSEAQCVGEFLRGEKIRTIIITTSKSHTRRALFIWQRAFKKSLNITMVAAKTDPFDEKEWWKDGRQIRWVLSEYGAWIFYFWKQVLMP